MLVLANNIEIIGEFSRRFIIIMHAKGIIAAGHPETVRAAEVILQENGNAFDAIVAAHLAACVAEPVLASFAGGGFLLAHTAENKNFVYDFFVQTPRNKVSDSELDFYPISANFGTAQQEFHIGLGSVATPGCVKGLFEIHRDLCTMPMARLAEPAMEMATKGVRVNSFHAYIFEIVQAIFCATTEAKYTFSGHAENQHLVSEGDILKLPHLAATLDALIHEGEPLFYRGEIAGRIADLCHEGGGHLNRRDLEDYNVVKRHPLQMSYHNAMVFLNPPPSTGGILIAFALKLLDDQKLARNTFGSRAHLDLLAKIMELTNKARVDNEALMSQSANDRHILDPVYLAKYRQLISGHAQALRGTTHMGVIDNKGNIASMSVSNGEGCGHLIPGTGIMLNNMLGEEDLNSDGFHNWTPDQRMTSMMSPTLLLTRSGAEIALGSGGSNRIRTAILQVIINLLDYGMSPVDAVNSPRIHYEKGLLNIEGGFDHREIKGLVKNFPDHKIWVERNLFFGGTHTVMHKSRRFDGAGDIRRGGIAQIVM